MASSAPFLLIAALIGVLSISTSARPCKTFLVSSYSFAFPNPNEPSSSARFVTVITEIRQFNLRPSDLFILPSENHMSEIRGPPKFPYDFTSLRDRTKDILSVVVALLFGVGCGALTAATMYLIWSLFSSRTDYSNSFDDESDSDDQFSPKKTGYVKIPADVVPAPAEKVAAW